MGNLRHDAKIELGKFIPVRTENFSGVENPNYKGISKDLEKEILIFLENHSKGDGENLTEQIYAKKLYDREKAQIPPFRFVNNVLLDEHSRRGHMIRVPEPIALLCQGDLTDLLQGRDIPLVYLSQNIGGKNLLQTYKDLDSKMIKPLIALLGITLGTLHEKGLYIMDFAPRDIVLPETDPHSYYLVDNENVIVLNPDNKSNIEKGIKEQLKEFKREYSSFPNFPELMKLFEDKLRER